MESGTKVATRSWAARQYRQRRFDRAFACGRQMGDSLSLIRVTDFDPNQATALQGIKVPSHRGAVERDLGGEARHRQRPEASERAQDGELGDAQPRGCKGRIIHRGERASGAAESAACARRFEWHKRVYARGLSECKAWPPVFNATQFCL